MTHQVDKALTRLIDVLRRPNPRRPSRWWLLRLMPVSQKRSISERPARGGLLERARTDGLC